eukprot:scaffold149_cov315-Pinguiococcus_pyrenoidosus.AAC.71
MRCSRSLARPESAADHQYASRSALVMIDTCDRSRTSNVGVLGGGLADLHGGRQIRFHNPGLSRSHSLGEPFSGSGVPVKDAFPRRPAPAALNEKL